VGTKVAIRPFLRLCPVPFNFRARPLNPTLLKTEATSGGPAKYKPAKLPPGLPRRIAEYFVPATQPREGHGESFPTSGSETGFRETVGYLSRGEDSKVPRGDRFRSAPAGSTVSRMKIELMRVLARCCLCRGCKILKSRLGLRIPDVFACRFS